MREWGSARKGPLSMLLRPRLERGTTEKVQIHRRLYGKAGGEAENG